jgi:hypothetical protein
MDGGRSLPLIASRRPSAAAAAAAMLAVVGLLMGHAPSPVSAALVATGINDSYTARHDRATFVPPSGVLGNDLNLLGGASAILVADVLHGTLSLQSDGGFGYWPAAGFVGTDTFQYRPSGFLSTAATVTIQVTNAAPVANPDSYSWAAGNLFVPAPGVLANDTDADGDVLIAEMVGGGVSGSLDLGSNGSITYSPGGGFSGSATFNYRVWDGLVWSPPTSVTLTRTASPTQTPTPTPPPTPTSPPAPTPNAPPPVIPTPTPFVPVPTPTLPGQLPPIRLPSPSPSLPLPLLGGNPGTDRSAPPSEAPTSGQSDRGSGPTASEDAEPGSGAVGAGPPSGGGPTSAQTGGGRAARLPSIEFDEQRLDVSGALVDLFAGVEIWAVPAATIAVPGLLVLVWLALQAVGAIAWLPAARRLQGGSAVARRRGRKR